jgi:RNA polymerase sigma-70 factor (ECF subfamily)
MTRLRDAQVSGDSTRFSELYLPCHKKLTMYCIGKLRDLELAENAATDCLIKLLEHDAPEDIRDVEGWLFTVARNQCLTYLNKESNRRQIRELLEPTWEREQAPSIEAYLAAEELQRVQQEVLDERDQRIWKLHLEGYRNEEIAADLGMPEKTVANRKSVVRRRLREAIEAQKN